MKIKCPFFFNQVSMRDLCGKDCCSCDGEFFEFFAAKYFQGCFYMIGWRDIELVIQWGVL